MASNTTTEDGTQPPNRLTKYRNAYADEQYIPDVTVDWMYRPHTLTAFAAVIGAILYLAWNTNSETASTVQNTKTGILAAVSFIIILGMIAFPSGPFIRPHPIMWRIVFAVAVCYEIFLIMILFQNKAGARHMMTYLDPKLGVPLKERSYAEHCELTWANISPNVFDIFVIGHFVGWVLKSLIIRDTMVCWFISITWEIIEIYFTHMLPNFKECWWDQWILDVLICNGLGIYVGNKLCEYLEVKKYDWKGVHQQPTYTDKVRRIISQFAPESWMKVRWDKTASLKRFFGVHLLVVAIHLEELNAFFLKYLLWVPPESSLNLIRLGFWFFFSLPCLRQFYVYMTDPTVKSIGRHSFMCIVIIATECLIILKMSAGEFTKPMSYNVRILLAAGVIAYVSFCAWGVWYILNNHPNDNVHADLSKKLTLVDSRSAPTIERTKEEVRVEQARSLVTETTSASSSTSSASRRRGNIAANYSSDESEEEEQQQAVAAASRRRSAAAAAAASPARRRYNALSKDAAETDSEEPAGPTPRKRGSSSTRASSRTRSPARGRRA